MKRAAIASPTERLYVSLRGAQRFAEVYRTGRRRRAGPLVIITGPGAAGAPQVGFVAGKRVGNAVERNRAKRRLRAAMDRVRLWPGRAYVVIAAPDAVTAPFDRLVDWLQEAVDAADQPQETEE